MTTYKFSISQKEKLTLISNLCTMLNAGISLLQAVHALSKGKKGNIKKLLDVVGEDLLQGKQLSFTFAKFPKIFDQVTISMLRASEEAGTLDVILQQIKDQIKKDMEFTNKIKSALFYPILVFVIFLGVILMILLVVIPRVATVFTQLKAKLPLPTVVLIATSNFLIHETWIVLLGLIIFIGGIVSLCKTKKDLFLASMYSLPVISQLVLEIDLMRFCQTMHLLLSSGLTITKSLDLAKDVVLKKESVRAIVFAREKVTSGKPMSTAFREMHRSFPDIMVTLIEVGEKTGTLDKSLLESADYFETKVADTLRMLVTLLEPITLVVVGLLIGGMMIAIIGPIYGLIGNISPH